MSTAGCSWLLLAVAPSYVKLRILRRMDYEMGRAMLALVEREKPNNLLIYLFKVTVGIPADCTHIPFGTKSKRNLWWMIQRLFTVAAMCMTLGANDPGRPKGMLGAWVIQGSSSGHIEQLGSGKHISRKPLSEANNCGSLFTESYLQFACHGEGGFSMGYICINSCDRHSLKNWRNRKPSGITIIYNISNLLDSHIFQVV